MPSQRTRVRLLAARLREHDFGTARRLLGQRRETLLKALSSSIAGIGPPFDTNAGNADHHAVMALLRLALASNGGAQFMAQCMARYGLDVDAPYVDDSDADEGSVTPLQTLIAPAGLWPRGSPFHHLTLPVPDAIKRRRAVHLLLALRADPSVAMEQLNFRGSGDTVVDLIVSVAYDIRAPPDPGDDDDAGRLDLIAVG